MISNRSTPGTIGNCVQAVEGRTLRPDQHGVSLADRAFGRWSVHLGLRGSPKAMKTHRRLLVVHCSMGLLLTLVVVVGRLVRAAAHAAHLPPFPKSMAMLQQRIAQANEFGLYGLLLLQPLTGLGDTLFRGHAFAVFRPRRFRRWRRRTSCFYHMLHSVHEYSAWRCWVHRLCTPRRFPFHKLILRDGVFRKRMLPRDGQRRIEAPVHLPAPHDTSCPVFA